VPDQTTIALFLYDVVSNTDAAGNITQKQNFEWFYNYTTESKQIAGEVRKTEGWQ
jgi:UDP-N-acetyl-D-mannosaminuronic acid transferase (WecB/TagA/CpsF family)